MAPTQGVRLHRCEGLLIPILPAARNLCHEGMALYEICPRTVCARTRADGTGSTRARAAPARSAVSVRECCVARTYYPELFRRACGDAAIAEPRIAKALAQFVRSLVSYQSRYDEGVSRATSVLDAFDNFTREENHGKALFMRSCATCHQPGEDHTFFVFLPANNGVERPTRVDGGFGDYTLNAQDLGRFKSPSLRNVEVAGPYMHNGRRHARRGDRPLQPELLAGRAAQLH